MKEVSDEVYFLHAEEHEGFLQINIMVLIGMIKHSQSSQSSKFTMFLQYFKQEVRDEVDFLHAGKHQSFYKLTLLFLIEVARHVHSTQNRKLVIFMQYIKKKVLKLLLCSIVMQNIQIFNGGPVMFVVTCYSM